MISTKYSIKSWLQFDSITDPGYTSWGNYTISGQGEVGEYFSSEFTGTTASYLFEDNEDGFLYPTGVDNGYINNGYFSVSNGIGYLYGSNISISAIAIYYDPPSTNQVLQYFIELQLLDEHGWKSLGIIPSGELTELENSNINNTIRFVFHERFSDEYPEYISLVPIKLRKVIGFQLEDTRFIDKFNNLRSQRVEVSVPPESELYRAINGKYLNRRLTNYIPKQVYVNDVLYWKANEEDGSFYIRGYDLALNSLQNQLDALRDEFIAALGYKEVTTTYPYEIMFGNPTNYPINGWTANGFVRNYRPSNIAASYDMIFLAGNGNNNTNFGPRWAPAEIKSPSINLSGKYGARIKLDVAPRGNHYTSSSHDIHISYSTNNGISFITNVNADVYSDYCDNSLKIANITINITNNNIRTSNVVFKISNTNGYLNVAETTNSYTVLSTATRGIYLGRVTIYSKENN